MFTIYVETNYLNQPNLLASHGLEDMPIIYSGFWPASANKDLLPEQSQVVSTVENYVALRASQGIPITKYLILDIEHWNLMIDNDALLSSRVDKLVTILNWAKLGVPPGVSVCYYAFPPTGGHYAAQSPGSASYLNWQHRNDLVKPIADNEDAIFPSYYALSDNQTVWKNVVTEYIKEVKRLAPGKPVFVFINPRYSPNAFNGLGYDPIPKEFFAAQLQHVQDQGGDGVVIWGADNANKEWDENIGWWVAVKEFLLASPPPPPPPPPPSSGLTATITADVYVTSNSPTTNFATSVSLKAKDSVDKSFLQVVVSGVPAEGVQSASLTMWVNNTTTGTLTLKSFAPTTPWVETDVTWNSQPQGVVGPVVSSIVAPALDAITFTGLESVINADGTYEFLLESTSATDGCDMSSTSEAVISARPFFTVVASQPANEAPVILSADIMDAFVGNLYSYQLVAENPEGDTLTYALVDAPVGMVISATGLIEWTPQESGVFGVEFSISDGVNTVGRMYAITVVLTCDQQLALRDAIIASHLNTIALRDAEIVGYLDTIQAAKNALGCTN